MVQQSQKELMIAGKMYNPMDPELVKGRLNARRLNRLYNSTKETDFRERNKILKELFNTRYPPFIEPPFYCDYGYNIKVGKNVFFNFNCVILDVCPVYLGDMTMFGPNVQIYAATHPLKASERYQGKEFGKPITIGKKCWIGGSVVINPGVSIGERTTIGAGSVVTRDIPDDVFAAGNPCKVIKELE